MTEEEAKTKWCPFARQVGGVASDWAGPGTEANTPAYGAVFNRAEGPGASAIYPAGAVCIGSLCMAWRKTTTMFDRRTNQVALPDTPSASLEPRYDGHGYCGLAGQP